MPHQSGPLITNNGLDQIARRWLEELRAEQPKAWERKSHGDAASYDTFLDRLLDTDDDAVSDSAPGEGR